MKELIELLMSLFSTHKKKEIQEKKVNKPLLESRENQEDPNDPVDFKNQQKRLQDEYKELCMHNPGLFNIIEELDEYVHKEFKKNIIITMIYRTQAEQDYLYRNSEKYKKKKFKSPHQFHDGVACLLFPAHGTSLDGAGMTPSVRFSSVIRGTIEADEVSVLQLTL